MAGVQSADVFGAVSAAPVAPPRGRTTNYSAVICFHDNGGQTFRCNLLAA